MLNLIVNKVNKVLEDRKLAQQGHLNNLAAAERSRLNPLRGKTFPLTESYVRYVIEETSITTEGNKVRTLVISSNGVHTVLISDNTVYNKGFRRSKDKLGAIGFMGHLQNEAGIKYGAFNR